MPKGVYSKTKEHKEKISKTLKGHIVLEKTRIKISKSHKGKVLSKETRQKLSESHKGFKSINWKGGISYEYGISEREENELREKIRERDNYCCQECYMNQEESKIKFNYLLHVHHIDYNKKNWKGKNLITLCKSCHGKTCHNKEYWIKHCKELLNKSFFIKGNKY